MEATKQCNQGQNVFASIKCVLRVQEQSVMTVFLLMYLHFYNMRVLPMYFS